MRLEDYLDFTTPDAIRIQGHRVGLEHVLSYYLEGYPVEDIVDEFPGMSLEKIYAVITYYLANRAAVDAYLVRVRERKEQDYQAWAQMPSSTVQRLHALQMQQALQQTA